MNTSRPRAASVLKEMKFEPTQNGGALVIPRAEWAGVFVSKKTTARFFGVAPGTLERWAREGRGPVATRVGNRTFYAREEIARWVDAKRKLSALAGQLRSMTSGLGQMVSGTVEGLRNIEQLATDPATAE